MSLELIREVVNLSQVIGEELTQTVVENDIIVPDVKPDINRILLLDGDIYIKSTETVQDKILINGAICFKILYISDDSEQSVKSINPTANFSYDLDVPGAKSGMKSKVKCDIEHIDYNILNGRKINTRAIVKLSGKIVNDVEQEIVSGVEGIEDLEVLRENVNISYSLGENEISCSVKESFEVPAGKPAIREILRNDIKITGKDYKITEGKIIVKGELGVSTLYVGDDEARSIQFMEHEIPFSQFIDLPGIDENASCSIECRIADSLFEAVEDSDGELRKINGEVSLTISASASARKSIEVLSDAYSPQMRLNLDKEPVSLEESIAESKSQIILKDTITLESGAPEIVEIFNVLCKPSLSDCKISDNRLSLEGVVNYNMLYLSNSAEQPVLCSRQEELFKHGIDIKGVKPGMRCEVDLDIEHCSYSMVSSNEVEVRLILIATARVSSQYSLPLIAKVAESPMEDKRTSSRPSIIIYFAQPGDTLWKISKKYSTSVRAVQKVNQISDTDPILPGQQIIIPGRVF
ncbi:MAG: DUF3794 domain-containing protein [Clostridiales bacterium]|nr:DUF3794 domain-containing protein [Eubacteriales bacterium]MDH7567091.1 DUF3794 domain-containing protein [Clostridiales bacterium]